MNPDVLIAAVLAYAQELKGVDFKPGTVQHAIDGLMYTSTKLPCSVGIELWPRLVALFGAAMTKAVATGDVEDAGDGMLLGLADRAMRDGLLPVVRDLLARMKCGQLRTTSKPGDVLPAFDEHFAGEYIHLVKVCAFAVAHNLRGPTLGAL